MKLSSRKFIMAIAILAIAIIYFSIGKLTENTFAEILFTIYGIYAGANVTTKFLTKKGGGSNG
jgi:hypothetical protein